MRRCGCARGAPGFALLWLGEGVGLGIDLGGALLRGAWDEADEIGYLPPGLPGTAPDIQALVGRPAVAMVAVLNPGLVVLAGPVDRAGTERLRDAVMAALPRTVSLDATVELTTVDDGPVVAGGLDAALASVRAGLVEAPRIP